MWLRVGAMRPSTPSDDRTPLGLGDAACMVVGSLAAAGLPDNRARVWTVGLGSVVDLPAAVLAPDDAQSWDTETARGAGTVPITGAVSRELRSDQVHLRPPARSPSASYRIQVMWSCASPTWSTNIPPSATVSSGEKSWRSNAAAWRSCEFRSASGTVGYWTPKTN